MRFFSFVLLAFLLKFSPAWETDFEQAMLKARTEHKYILLNFSGSDWCGPCITMRKSIFENIVFANFAETNLILMNADFPRMKKHQLSKDMQAKNNKLADEYNPRGNFPLTLLIDTTGKVIHSWEGLPPVSAVQFTNQLKDLLNVPR